MLTHPYPCAQQNMKVKTTLTWDKAHPKCQLCSLGFPFQEHCDATEPWEPLLALSTSQMVGTSLIHPSSCHCNSKEKAEQTPPTSPCVSHAGCMLLIAPSMTCCDNTPCSASHPSGNESSLQK